MIVIWISATGLRYFALSVELEVLETKTSLETHFFAYILPYILNLLLKLHMNSEGYLL